MRRTGWYLLLLLLLPQTSSALQLRWRDGTTDLAFTTATRCWLIVQADSAEVTLPSQWRLLWLADSSGVNVVAADSLAACQTDTALVSQVDAPSTPADSAANQVIAHFCSAGSVASAIAYFVIDQPGGSKGRLKVVALDPTDADSSRVIESNEVTYNGGVSGAYAPIVLRASRSHATTELRVEAVGIGLADAPWIEIASPDTSWQVPLTVRERSDTRLSVSARVAADLPPFVLRVGNSSGETGVVALAADTASVLSIQPACTNELKEINLISHEDIQPKDFATVAWRDSFHVFYTRQDYNLRSTPNLDSKIIGHKRSHDLYNWDPDEHTMSAVVARPGLWDGRHVWAPTIIKKSNDPTYYMLYTGVDTNDVQRIGVATSTDLNVWRQDSTAIYESSDVDWALLGTPEFRDPFVMPDPDFDGHYLLYFVTKTQVRGRYVVGVARTTPTGPGNLRSWTDPQPLWNTDSLSSGAAFIESPHAFQDPGDRWWLFYTGYNSGSAQDSAFVTFQTNDVSPSSSDTTIWSPPDTLYRFHGGDQKLQFWHASEYYGWTSSYEYLMAFNDSEHSVDISQVSWHDPHAFVLRDSCPPRPPLDVAGAPQTAGIELEVLGRRPDMAPIAFQVRLPARGRAELVIFDIAGRRVRTLLDEELPSGERVVRWDGQSGLGEASGTGVYFARLSGVGGQRVAKLVLLR